MNYCCSQCDFKSQFESALIMHRQLHHEEPTTDIQYTRDVIAPILTERYTSPRDVRTSLNQCPSGNKDRGHKSLGRTSSATKLLGKLRARICRSRMLFSHPEETADLAANDIPVPNECTSKAVKMNSNISRCSAVTAIIEPDKETYGCHICSYDADRITALDRHLLNDHKIGLDNLLKLVLAKTKDGLSESNQNATIHGIRQPYYKTQDEIIEEGEFVIETVSPKIKILKHAHTNTEIQWADIPNLKENCRMITRELDKLMKYPIESSNKEEFMSKMQTLNECMCKFVNSSNMLKRVLTKEFDTKYEKERLNGSLMEQFFDFGLGDSQENPREWEKAHSERMERGRYKYRENCRGGDKGKFLSESFYF